MLCPQCCEWFASFRDLVFHVSEAHPSLKDESVRLLSEKDAQQARQEFGAALKALGMLDTEQSMENQNIDVSKKSDAELEDMLLDLCGRPELSDREVEILRSVEDERERRRKA